MTDSRTSFIPEWSSCCIHMIDSNSSTQGILDCVVFAPDQMLMHLSPSPYTICNFPSGTKFVFSLYDTRMTFCTSTRISIRMKTWMNSFWNDWYRNKIMWTDTKKYMKMEWTRSGMKVIPVSCKQLLRLFNPSTSLQLSRYLKGHKIKCFKPLTKREHPQNIWYFSCLLMHILINSKNHQT